MLKNVFTQMPKQCPGVQNIQLNVSYQYRSLTEKLIKFTDCQSLNIQIFYTNWSTSADIKIMSEIYGKHREFLSSVYSIFG